MDVGKVRRKWDLFHCVTAAYGLPSWVSKTVKKFTEKQSLISKCMFPLASSTPLNHRQGRVHQQCGPSPSLPVGSGDWPLGLSSASVTHPVVASFYLMLDENPRSMRGHCWARLPADASGSETGCQ